MAATRRFQQGLRALLAFSMPIDDDLAAQYLSSEQFTMFKKMARSEQLHSLNVLRDVLQQAKTTPHDLTVAALLHDIGKTRYRLMIWQKTLAVLVRQFFPSLDRHLRQQKKMTFWRAPFIMRYHHPAWSAELLAKVDASECTIWLAAQHQTPIAALADHPHVELLKRLQIADEAN